jgi:uncharacterized membrane protein YphA (DoxX/SURF4 family)
MPHRPRLEAVALVLLRTLIGWHFLYEGYYKLVVPGWTRAGAPVGAWSASGELVFSPSSTAGLMRRAAGVSITTFSTLYSANGESSHAWPSFLGDGKHVIFFVSASQPSGSGTWIASLDDPSQRRRLVASTGQAIVVDHTLLYLRELGLVAQAIAPLSV